MTNQSWPIVLIAVLAPGFLAGAEIKHVGTVECLDTAKCQLPTLNVFELKGQSTETQGFTLNNRTSEVSRTYNRQGLGIVLGKLKYGGDIASFVDIESASLLAEVYAYDLQVSPSGRFLLYNEWYPRMAPPDYRRAKVLMLDVDQVPFDTESPSGTLLYPVDTPRRERPLALSNLNASWSSGETSVVFWVYSSDDPASVGIIHASTTGHGRCIFPLFGTAEKAKFEQSVVEFGHVPKSLLLLEDQTIRVTTVYNGNMASSLEIDINPSCRNVP